MTTTIDKFREGDVVRYDTLDRPDRWCREGMAVARAPHWHGSSEKLVLRDTYWGSGTSGEDHVVTTEELGTAELLFNLNDVEPVKSTPLWNRYRPEDRLFYTEQHGLTRHLFVPRGAQYDRAAELELQRQLVTDAIAKRDSAVSDIAWNRQRYHEMLADPTVTPFAY